MEQRPKKRDIDVTVTEMTRDSIQFEQRNCDLAMANTQRRIMIAEVPTIAIDIVRVHVNTSPLFDEFIVHRLGLIPIQSRDAEHMPFSYECPCTGNCENCSIEFSLDVTNTTDHNITVTSRDLIGSSTKYPSVQPIGPSHEKNDPLTTSLLPNPHYDDIAIVKLAPRQSLQLVAIAKKVSIFYLLLHMYIHIYINILYTGYRKRTCKMDTNRNYNIFCETKRSTQSK